MIGTLVNKSAVIEREIRAIHNPVGVAVAGSGIIQDQASAVQRGVAGIKMGNVSAEGQVTRAQLIQAVGVAGGQGTAEGDILAIGIKGDRPAAPDNSRGVVHGVVGRVLQATAGEGDIAAAAQGAGTIQSENAHYRAADGSDARVGIGSGKGQRPAAGLGQACRVGGVDDAGKRYVIVARIKQNAARHGIFEPGTPILSCTGERVLQSATAEGDVATVAKRCGIVGDERASRERGGAGVGVGSVELPGARV